MRIGLMCYKKKNNEEVKEWLDEKIDERKRLYKVMIFWCLKVYFCFQFLEKEKSLLPELEANHSVFDTNLFDDAAQRRLNERMQEHVNKDAKENKKFFQWFLRIKKVFVRRKDLYFSIY